MEFLYVPPAAVLLPEPVFELPEYVLPFFAEFEAELLLLLPYVLLVPVLLLDVALPVFDLEDVELVDDVVAEFVEVLALAWESCFLVEASSFVRAAFLRVRSATSSLSSPAALAASASALAFFVSA